MNIKRLVTWITFLAIFVMAMRVSVDNDTWWHLRAGQWIVEQRAVPQVDPFSYTRLGESWQYPGWLVEAPMYWLYRAFGPGGLNLWTALMVTLTFACLWPVLSGGPFLRAFVMVLAAAASGIYWAARPYLVTFLLAGVFLLILENFRWRRTMHAGRWLWALPLLMVVWANSHGGFAVGFLLWGVYAFGVLVAWIWKGEMAEKLRAAWRYPKMTLREGEYILWWVGALMILAVCINPSGPVLLAYPFKTVSIGALQQYIQEWQPPDMQSTAVQPFIWLLLLTFAALGAGRRRAALTDWLLFTGFAYMALLAGRNVPLFALAAPLALTRHAAPALAVLGRALGIHPSPPRRAGKLQSRLNWTILIVLALAVMLRTAAYLPESASRAEFERSLPLRAVEFLRAERPQGRLFNSYNWGGYLLWALPEYPVFIDGRTDLYNDEIVETWLQVMRGDAGWEKTLDDWAVHLILVEPGAPLARLLETSGWRLLYQDEVSVLYSR